MRILHVADLHYRLGWYEWVRNQADNYDVLVIAGDLLNMLPSEDTPLPKQAKNIREWLGALSKFTVICSGNHDIWPGNPLASVDTWADGGWFQLCKREMLIVDGQVAQYADECFASVKWGLTDWPANASVVVTHAPPARTPVGIDANGADLGNIAIAERIANSHLKYVLSGHVHKATDWLTIVGPIYCFNPGCDWFAQVPNHIYIDTEKKWATWHSAIKGTEVRAL